MWPLPFGIATKDKEHVITSVVARPPVKSESLMLEADSDDGAHGPLVRSVKFLKGTGSLRLLKMLALVSPLHR
eukprot:6101730-Amphidinium_carterae.1